MFKGKNTESIGIHCLLAMLYFAAVPLTITINESGVSYLKIFTMPVALFFFISMFFYQGKLEMNFVHGFSLLYLFSVICTLFVAHDHLSVIQVIGYVQSFALMFFITFRAYNAREIQWLDNIQLVLLAILIYMSFAGGATYADRTTIEILGGVSDPNYFCGFFLFPIAVCLNKIAKNEQRILCVILFLLGMYVIVLSGSRGGLLGAIVEIIFFVILRSGSFFKAIVHLLSVFLVACLLWIIILPNLPENITERMSVSAVIESRGTYRGDIWMSMLDEIKNSDRLIFTGRGIHAQHKMIIAGKEQLVVAHNNFIQILYNQGIFGLISFMVLCIVSVFRNIKKRPHIAVGMVGLLTLSMTLTINASIKSFWNLIIYAAFAFNMEEKENKGGLMAYD